MLTQLKESHANQKLAAEQVIELKDALKTAADTVRECHKTNIALASEKKVCALQYTTHNHPQLPFCWLQYVYQHG